MKSSRNRMACLLIASAALFPAAAQQSPLHYNLPAGWTRSVEGGVETLVPGTEPPGTVQTILLAPKPLAADFESQFDSELRALESGWGLTAPLSAPLQKGRTAAGPYAAHFASYSSEGGPRYMSFLALGRQGRFCMVVFVAASDDAFNRLAPLTTRLWQDMEVLP